jgi:hypothetical protein
MHRLSIRWAAQCRLRCSAKALLHPKSNPTLLPKNELHSNGVVVQLKAPQTIVIPKRGIVARGICCFAAVGKQIPRR